MLKTIILNLLLVCHRADRMLPKPLIRRQCEMEMDGRIGDGDFDAVFGELQDKGFISSVENKLSGDLKYFITDLGRAQL